ncbi:MAG TPA: GxxExxY protein [Candidatus Kapabacteria bacterium]|nr:GxxExxY protein [Candidatus Kapabacteria bacterium]
MESETPKTNGLSMEDGNLTGAVIGCAMHVHNYLGCGFQEFIYQNALEIEMAKTSLRFIREYELPIFYYEQKIGARRVDFLIEDRIPIELKAIEALQDVHLAQAKNYLEAFQLRVGLLINFGGKSLQVKRLINSKASSKKTDFKKQ